MEVMSKGTISPVSRQSFRGKGISELTSLISFQSKGGTDGLNLRILALKREKEEKALSIWSVGNSKKSKQPIRSMYCKQETMKEGKGTSNLFEKSLEQNSCSLTMGRTKKIGLGTDKNSSNT